MKDVRCTLIAHSMREHLQQVYAGYFLLYRQGLIDLRQKIVTGGASSSKRHPYLRVVLNDSLILHYDTRDASTIDTEFVRESDVYFKRSYCPDSLRGLGPASARVQPLGLNYEVYPGRFNKFHLERWLHLAGKSPSTLARLVRSCISGSARALDMQRLCALPDYSAEPRVLFMVRTWDPLDNPHASAREREERTCINTMRAECIQLLRKELGSSFYGGFVHTPHAAAHYPSLLLPDHALSAKLRYLRALPSFPICIATTGLYGSIGWKLAEYVAFSRAIVSERLNYVVPGPFSNGTHYLEFSSPEQCVHNAVTLMSDHTLRHSLMLNNAQYYNDFVRPDSMILKSLLTAFRIQNQMPAAWTKESDRVSRAASSR